MRPRRFAPHRDTFRRFVRKTSPADGPADRTLLIVHGTGEHSGRYSHLVPHVVARGWNVVAGDLRGHGLSAGTATHLDDFEQYLEDLDAVCDHFELDPVRTALFGHSLGGLVAIRYAQTRPRRIAALIASAPLLAFGMRIPMSKWILGRLCLFVAPQTRFQTRVPLADITRSEEALARRIADPLTNRTVTAGWYFCVAEALRLARDDSAHLRVPLLLLQGDADRVVRPDAAVQWFFNAGGADKTLWILRDHLHELLNEPGWEQTLEQMLGWLETRVPSHCSANHTLSATCQPVADGFEIANQPSQSANRDGWPLCAPR